MFDLLIRNARVIDGTGRPAFDADVAVSNGRIVEVGPIPHQAPATRIIDAADPVTPSPPHPFTPPGLVRSAPPDTQRLVLCPGFIDIHTHADIALLARPDHLPKVLQGVTTEVFTNCGLGFAPASRDGLATQSEYLKGLFGDDAGVDWSWSSAADLLARYERQGVATNIAYLVPHGSLRVSVMGMAARPAGPDEVAAMESMLAEGMEQGAWGLSTGLWYAPMCHADRAEIVALCRRAGFFATHQRDYGKHLFPATQETIDIAREAAVPVQLSHLQLNGAGIAGRADELLAQLDRARADGVDITWDSYPYAAGSTLIQALLPAWATDGGPSATLDRLADSESAKRIGDELAASDRDWDRMMLAGSRSAANRPYEGISFAEIAGRRGISVPELILRLLVEEELQACYIAHLMDESDVRTILQHPAQMVGSDGLHVPGKPHPRLYGTFPRVLAHYVREQRLLPLEEAIRKMTSAPAARLGLRDRGTIAPGHAADLVVFDPGAVRDAATFEDPLQFPEGLPHVFVNGVALKLNGRPTHALPGQVLRRA